MRIVFFGTSLFSASVLEFLVLQGFSIVGIVTRPDKPQGRDLKMGPSPVKQLAVSSNWNIPLFQPEKASTDIFCAQLQELQADLFLVVAYGEILKQNILSLPSKACINIHTSLLPKYRGAAPIQSCLKQGDTISGVTFMEMAQRMDAGDILKQEKVSIELDTNAEELEALLLQVTKKALPDLLLHFDDYYANKCPQEEEKATYVKKITAQDCIPDWTRSVEDLHNQVRALSPFPGIFIRLQIGKDVKRLKILKTSAEHSSVLSFGTLYRGSNFLKISCANGFLFLLRVQLEGKKSMQTEDFLRGIPKQTPFILFS